MLDEKIIEGLKEFGLENNEINVYTTLLKTGESSVQAIAKNSSIPRTTTYHVLSNLIDKGIVSFAIKNKIKIFIASNPKELLKIIELKKQSIENIIPELNKITNTINKKPKMTLFEGPNGIKNLLQTILNDKEEIYHYGNIDLIENELKYIFPQFIIKRIENKIPIKIISEKLDKTQKYEKNSKVQLREYKFVPKNIIVKTNTFITKKKIIILNLNKEPIHGVLYEDEDYCNLQRTIFEMLWKKF